ncbi:AAA family ATPase [Pseudomonas sp. DTU_2021_1001937_2_SI_NGA_ILE_001]|uniref:AAA family ATPase n=1 Tax=Pseudomonas sp. DTU_2021_1001937_2_SI_NGA_ILE_001 TaxID=3077589 RepID=UPI0028FC2B19|nr:AAA family ATPase [Pseudomonas sp. DTU_2021_1001937_2_SI_NGA_ILE_001]WNW11828.1 AAA family ATPase [Pseudomonas sp. DTU_2021_1001937_2_SI_NGA_ILE_001]
MRLRYLHLKNYPPVADIKVCFASGSPLGRACAIRFVVGVNGSGKSNLLRAVAEVFLALADLRVPAFPVSLIYELGVRGSPSHRTLLLHCPGNRHLASLWLHERFAFDDQNGQEVFETCIEHLNLKGAPAVPGFSALIAPGSWPLRDSTPPQIALPSAVLAYTTGDLRPWRSVWSRNQRAEGLLETGDDAQSDERPAGWSAAQEEALQASRQSSAETSRSRFSSNADSDQFRRPVLLDPTLLKCALLAVALPKVFVETTGYPLSAEANSEIATLRQSDNNKNALQDLLRRGGCHHLVSVAFRSRLQTDQWDQKVCETAHDWWLCASEVIAEPHPIDTRRTLFFDLNGPFDALGSSFVSSARVELQTCRSQGEALWALLGGAADASAFDIFTRLLELNQTGLFDDVLLRLRRAPVPVSGGELSTEDIGVLRYEELSDGEQMVLGRMALFHLLQGQQDALLLLDEPETHFNDKWKREIVDIIDDAIGHTTNDVLISTHSAIVLSDVFSNEIVMVEKSAQGSIARTVIEPTFATDPSALMMTVFRADDSIGKRAQEFIEGKLRQATGTPAEIADLERLIDQMGSGFYRSELRTLLNTWRG